LADRAPNGVRVLQRLAAVEFVEPEADQRLGFVLGAARRARDLLDRDRLSLRPSLRGTDPHVTYSGEMSATARRAERISATDLPRLLAIIFGENSFFNASNVARTML